MSDLRSRITDSVCNEVRGAIEETIADNHRLKSEFRLLLRELEEKDLELKRIKREGWNC